MGLFFVNTENECPSHAFLDRHCTTGVKSNDVPKVKLTADEYILPFSNEDLLGHLSATLRISLLKTALVDVCFP